MLLGRALLRRLPMVWQALREGLIDYFRASAFVDCLYDLDETKARAIAQLLLERAQSWTVSQLRERVNSHAHRADPTLAKRRYTRSVADRQVWLQPFTDGTAFLGASNLPPHQAAAAFDHLDRLARAAKAAGDPRTLPQLRADAYLAMLTGAPFRLQPPVDRINAAADDAVPPRGGTQSDRASHPGAAAPAGSPAPEAGLGHNVPAPPAWTDEDWPDQPPDDDPPDAWRPNQEPSEDTPGTPGDRSSGDPTLDYATTSHSGQSSLAPAAGPADAANDEAM
jgi:hypothetical protein